MKTATYALTVLGLVGLGLAAWHFTMGKPAPWTAPKAPATPSPYGGNPGDPVVSYPEIVKNAPPVTIPEGDPVVVYPGLGVGTATTNSTGMQVF